MNQSNNEKMRCDNCRFFDVKHYDQNNPQMTGLGQCRRRATGHPSTSGRTPFPVVWVDDWCGDFEQAGEAISTADVLSCTVGPNAIGVESGTIGPHGVGGG